MAATASALSEIAALFPGLHPPLTPQAAIIEADRCLNCFDAPCTLACPTHIDVPRFIKKIASGNLRGSAHTILEANVLAASCSRVCPVEVLCEGSCVLHRHNKQPIAIGKLQRHAMETFHATGGKLRLKSTAQRSEKIACIGSGPASLAAAAELRQQGFQVTVFDKRPLPGGLNTYGVAEYKLRPADSLREIDLIAQLGVTFRFNEDIATEAALAQLDRDFDILFLGLGLGPMHTLDLPGGDHPGIIDALRFIQDYKLGNITRIEGSVAVIGAGNTAIDAAIAAKRLGATEVSVLYRRTEPYISAFDFEYAHAQREGVRFHWLTQPVAIHADGPRLRSIECAAMQLDPTGSLILVDAPTVHISCDLVIPAIGQSPLTVLLSRIHGVQLDRGRVLIDCATGQTANPRIFAGGDCANGGREVVDAVADGKRAALAIAAQLTSLQPLSS